MAGELEEYRLPISHGRKAIFHLPRDLEQADIDRMKQCLDLFAPAIVRQNNQTDQRIGFLSNP